MSNPDTFHPPHNEHDAITQARADIVAAIDTAAQQARRSAGDVTLVAVSKKQPQARIDAALAAGHRVFGENRVQEAQQRWAPRRPEYPDLQLRLIGPLQTNKAQDAVDLFDVIETLDREKLAKALVKAMAKSGRTPQLYVQINTGEEPQKAGLAPTDTPQFLQRMREEYGLTIHGLMCIPPAGQAPAPHFALLHDIAARHGIPNLSMGMSGDYQTAVRHGATHVRVGSALFGTRTA